MPRLIKPLTNLEVKARSKIIGSHTVGGVKGLSLRVHRTKGEQFKSCYWFLRIQHQKRTLVTTIGRYPEMSLKEARQVAQKVTYEFQHDAMLRSEAHQPQTASKQKPLTSLKPVPDKQNIKVNDALNEFLNVKEREWKHGHEERKRVSSVLKKHLRSILKMMVCDVTCHDIAKALKLVWQKNYPTFEKNLPRVSKFFQWAGAMGYRNINDANPADPNIIRMLLPRPKSNFLSNHHACLAPNDIPKFIRQLCNEEALSGKCLLFTILTCVRSLNARAMTWDELNEDFTVWTIPAARMKVGENGQHVVPLSSQATALLREIRSLGYQGIYVFSAGSTTKPLSSTAMTKLVQRMHAKQLKIDNKGWIDPVLSAEAGEPRVAVPHGIARSSFTTWAIDTGEVKERIVDLILHHRVSKYKGSYDRAYNLPEKREALQKWADFCFSWNQ